MRLLSDTVKEQSNLLVDTHKILVAKEEGKYDIGSLVQIVLYAFIFYEMFAWKVKRNQQVCVIIVVLAFLIIKHILI